LSERALLKRAKLAGCVAALLLTPCFAQLSYAQERHSAPPSNADGQWHHFEKAPSGGNAPHPQNQPGHAGNWLRRYKDMSPAQQHRALENDPQFRKLPPQRQAELQRRLQHFSSLPPQQQERVLRRMEVWEHMTQDQRQQARQLFQQFKQLPPDRRQALNGAIRSMRGLTPAQRESLINSPQFQNAFSPQERGLLRGASRLPLAPGDGVQGPPE
jgi:Protein of unknown function (DUF3106)